MLHNIMKDKQFNKNFNDEKAAWQLHFNQALW